MICRLLVAGLKSFLQARAQLARWCVCGAVVGLFTWNVSLFYLPGQAFTYLIEFGTKEDPRYLPEVKRANHYEMPDSPGYDSQWYAQIAMHPRLGDPVLARAVDNLPYRARRILFEWTAWLIGGGDPTRAMDAYAFQNIFCWYALAYLLFRWFPPISWGNCFRWAGVLCSFGLIFSVRAALLDGPSLLLLLLGMVLVERGRTWWAAALLGVSGLGKDTNVLAATIFAPEGPPDRRRWFRAAGQVALVVAPLGLWIAVIGRWLGASVEVGRRNFLPPFAGLVEKAGDIVSSLLAHGYPRPAVIDYDLLVLVGLLAQFFFFLLRPRWRDTWWRLGAGYAFLMIFLGDAVWESYPSAASRVLLPMTMAFNVLVPRKGWWWAVLLLGNLGMVAAPDLLKPPGHENLMVDGPVELRINPGNNAQVTVAFGKKNWWDMEGSRWGSFRWSMGDSVVTLHNPLPFPIEADVHFGVRSVDARGAKVSAHGHVIWQDQLQPGKVLGVVIRGVLMPQGDTELLFQSDRPAAYPGNGDLRHLTFSVRDFEIDLKERR